MSSATTPSFLEDQVSQIPALQVLMNLGYEYVTPDEAIRQRGGKTSGVLLDGVLEQQLRKMNRIVAKGQDHAFTEGNITAAIAAIKDVLFDGLIHTNEKVYDLLVLGKSLPQTILGDTKSHPLHYIDWTNPANNVYHVTAEFVVNRPGLPSVGEARDDEDAADDASSNRRPDIVLFVNGIPLCVIECKSPALQGNRPPVDRAVRQHIRNQRLDQGTPKLFLYGQLLLALATDTAKYATVGTGEKFWAVWKEMEDKEADVADVVARPIASLQKDSLFSGPFRASRSRFDQLEHDGGRQVTAQDRALYSLCRHTRLLELARRYTLFDAGEKKVARYQQFFTVREILGRIRERDAEGRRRGGVVWHTQGSGKSLTMVMLAEGIALECGLDDYKIVLVTDRVDLDDQIYKTFASCGADVVQAATGTHLADMLGGPAKRIITTIINKFDAVSGRPGLRIDDANIFVLVDEGHRGQYGPMHANMRRVLPKACFIGFTGTPVMKKEKNTIDQFGGLIPPPYTITQAVADKAVVPLLYEGRHVDLTVDAKAMDAWFDRVTESLSKEQKADLKKKFARADQLNRAEKLVMQVAYDISVHFRDSWKGTGFKAQLVTPRKETALRYKKHLDDFGMVSSQVLISGPGESEGEADVHDDSDDAVTKFWNTMVGKAGRYATEKDYNDKVIEAFKRGDDPEIIVVVDKLLTGFDAPRNTVLYLTRKLEDHRLLQAIARVNRLHEGKDFGFIVDYRGVLGALDTAMTLYKSLENYDPADLDGTVADVDAEVAHLPGRYTNVVAIFGGIKGNGDQEPYLRLLNDQKVRDDFYQRLSAYARTLSVALSSAKFLEQTSPDRLKKYKGDLKFWMQLRVAARHRYAEEINFGEYETRIRKLIDQHVGAGEIEQITPLVNIFDEDAFKREVEALEGEASKANTIAHRTKKTISERMADDPAFYKRFSKMLEEAIEAFRAERLTDADYLKKVEDIQRAVRDRTGDELPAPIRTRAAARAFYGEAMAFLVKLVPADQASRVGTDLALGVDDIITNLRIVDWVANPDVQNRMRIGIEDFLFELKKKDKLALTFDDIDRLMEQCLDIARRHYA